MFLDLERVFFCEVIIVHVINLKYLLKNHKLNTLKGMVISSSQESEGSEY